MRFLSTLLLVLPFLIFGINKIMDPVNNAAYLKTLPNVAFVAKEAGVKLGDAEYILLAQAIGGIEFGFAFFTLVLSGSVKRFFAWLLALSIIAITFFGHFDINKPDAALSDIHTFIQIVKNIGLLGGILLVATSQSNRKPAVAAGLAAKSPSPAGSRPAAKKQQ